MILSKIIVEYSLHKILVLENCEVWSWLIVYIAIDRYISRYSMYGMSSPG